MSLAVILSPSKDVDLKPPPVSTCLHGAPPAKVLHGGQAPRRRQASST